MYPVNRIEPVLPSPNSASLENITIDLAHKAGGFAAGIHPIVQAAMGELVRSMNCYYSNLIEGRHTFPRDIDKALKRDYSAEPEKRNLQREAVAHIEVQAMLDSGNCPDLEPTSKEFICWIHRECFSRLPDELLWTKHPKTGESIRIEPGELRNCDVQVGRHIAPEWQEGGDLLDYFEERYATAPVSKLQKLIAIPAAHHRFAWIHPFLDGNGRVARLMSHAMFLRQGFGSSMWSAARGLAREVNKYKGLLAAAV